MQGSRRWRQSRRARCALVAAVATGAGLLIAVFTPLVAGATKGDPHEIRLCHATSSASNPFRSFSVDAATVLKGGHGQHAADIIPPFDFGAGTAYGGKNWSAQGQAIWNAGCVVAPVTTTTTTPPTTRPPTPTLPRPTPHSVPPPPPPVVVPQIASPPVTVPPPPPPPRPTTTTSTSTTSTSTTTSTTTTTIAPVRRHEVELASANSSVGVPSFAFAGGVMFAALLGLFFRRFS